MKEILTIWIVFQLIIIGWVYGELAWELDNDSYDCHSSFEGESKFGVQIVSTMAPLIHFTSGLEEIKSYCDQNPKLLNKLRK